MARLKTTTAILREQTSSRSTAFTILSTISLLSAIVVAAVMTSLTSTIISSKQSTLVAACVLEYLLVISIMSMVAVRIVRQHWITLQAPQFCFIALVLAANTVTAYSLIRIVPEYYRLQDKTVQNTIYAGLVFVGIAAITQLGFFGLNLLSSTEVSPTEKGSVGSPASTRTFTFPLPPYKQTPPLSQLKLSLHTCGSQSSILQLQSVVHSIPYDHLPIPRYPSLREKSNPISSTTQLLGRVTQDKEQVQPEHAAQVSPESRESDGFESWDYKTCSIPQPQMTRFVRRPSTRLEPIPGSRPDSPAGLLADATSLSADVLGPSKPPPSPQDSVLESPSIVTTNADITWGVIKPPSASVCRQPSFSKNHIHPLFRAESPAPPPTASPGTTITASPYAGHVVSPNDKFTKRLSLTHIQRCDSARSIRITSQPPLGSPPNFTPIAPPRPMHIVSQQSRSVR